MNAAAVLLAMMVPAQAPPVPVEGGEFGGLMGVRIGDEIGSRRIMIGRKIKISIKNSPNAIVYISPRITDNSRSVKLVNRLPLFARWRERIYQRRQFK